MLKKPIGGYFELELRKGEHYHEDAIRLNTAQNCFEYVLKARRYTKVFVPYYTCEVMLVPIRKLGIDFEFYQINLQLEPVSLPRLGATEAFLYTNYYGLKQSYAEQLAKEYGSQLILDNAQAFFAEPIKGIDTFYSCRKYFGVADGAYLYTDSNLGLVLEQDVSCDRMSHLLKRIDIGPEAGYQDFCNNEKSLCNQEIKRMSNLTESLLSGIDYEDAKQKRRANYGMLEDALKDSNLIHLDLALDSVPMVYPYLTKDQSLKQRLIDNMVFVATYWPKVKEWTIERMLEREFVDNLIPIPCDQRYSQNDIRRIIQVVLK